MKDKERINHCKHRYTAFGQETIVVVMVVVVVEEPNLVERQRNDYPLLTQMHSLWPGEREDKVELEEERRSIDVARLQQNNEN